DLSQDIVEKVIELIPIPQEASLTRYVAQIDEDKSSVLLNAKIKLKVDAVEKIDTKNGWQFNLVGSTFVLINRNKDGKIIQTPFIEFTGKFPNNDMNNKNEILQASTADIQFSNKLEDCPYVFLFQNNFKPNNSYPSMGSTDCKNTDNDAIACNTILSHFKSHQLSTENNISNNSSYQSSFGTTNLITPIITIVTNHQPYDIPLNTNLGQLRTQKPMYLHMKMYRLHNGGYKRIKHPSNNLILLPNDKIISK